MPTFENAIVNKSKAYYEKYGLTSPVHMGIMHGLNFARAYGHN